MLKSCADADGVAAWPLRHIVDTGNVGHSECNTKRSEGVMSAESGRPTNSNQNSSDEASGEKSPSRRDILLTSTALVAATALGALATDEQPRPQDKPAPATGKQPNILVIWGDDIGQGNISAYTKGLMGYRTPNIDRVANEGMIFTDYYGEQSCTAGRSSFITGQSVFRTGLSKVGLPGADLGLRAEDPPVPRPCSRRGAVQPANWARTISATGISFCRRYTASTNSWATSII